MRHKLGTYVYFSILEDIDPKYAEKAREYSTFDPNTGINNKKNEIQPINDAIKQLEAIAATQAEKEHLAIQNYIKKINKYINDESCPKALRDKLQLQKDKLSTKNLDFENFQTNQFDLINSINIIQQDLNSYEQRLSQLSTKVPKYGAEKRLPYNIQTRVETFLKNQSKKQRVQDNYTNIKRDRALKQMIEKSVQSQLRNMPSNLSQELISLIFIDFNVWIENSRNTSYLNITDEMLDTLFRDYLGQSGQAGKETHVQKLLRNSSEELLILAEDLQKNLHGTYISEKEYTQLKDFQNQDKKDSIKIKDKFYSHRQAQQLIDAYDKEIYEHEDERYVFTIHSTTSHGNFYEFLQTVIAGGANVSANAGADLIIPVATVSYGEKNEQNQQRLIKLSRNLGELISEDFNHQEEINIENFNEQVKKQQALSKSLQARMKNTAKTMTKMGELNEDFFIAHESLKLYRSSEEESNFQEFHGRKMNILSALAKLYSSPILANSLVSSNMLITYLINISDVTLANNKDPLETYLSLFAGMLMFDDIRTLAITGIEQVRANLETATVDCLHLYNIDGIFIPISVILNNLIEQMNDVMYGLNSLNSNGTAIAVIKGPTPEIPNTIQTDAWESLANSTIQNTTIQIHFLRGFTEYIQQLFSNLG